MTVGELKAELARYPDDAPVVAAVRAEPRGTFSRPRIVSDVGRRERAGVVHPLLIQDVEVSGSMA